MSRITAHASNRCNWRTERTRSHTQIACTLADSKCAQDGGLGWLRVKMSAQQTSGHRFWRPLLNQQVYPEPADVGGTLKPPGLPVAESTRLPAPARAELVDHEVRFGGWLGAQPLAPHIELLPVSPGALTCTEMQSAGQFSVDLTQATAWTPRLGVALAPVVPASFTPYCSPYRPAVMPQYERLVLISSRVHQALEV